MYKCEEEKQHQKDHPTEISLCCHCTMFIHEADKCLENSVISPVYHAFWEEGPPKYCHFNDDGSKGKMVLIQMVTQKNTEEPK